MTPDDWPILRAVAHQLNGRSPLDAHEVERTAIRLGNYLRTRAFNAIVTNDVFGVAGDSAWVILDFADGLDALAIPVSR